MSRYRNILAAIVATCCLSVHAGHFGFGTNHDVTAITYGTNAVTAIYSGSNLVWSSGPTAFSPLDVPDLALWIDVSNAGTLTLDGASISQTSDLSGRGKHLAQATSDSMPTIMAGVQNGLPVAWFDGTNDWLACAGAGLGYAPDTFLVVKVLTFSITGLFFTSPQNGYMTGSYGGIGGTIVAIRSSGGSIATLTGITGFNAVRVYYGRDEGIDASQLSSGATTSRFTCVASDYVAASLENIDIGRFNAPGHYQNCQIGEILVFSNKVSDVDAERINSYLIDKWGL